MQSFIEIRDPDNGEVQRVEIALLLDGAEFSINGRSFFSQNGIYSFIEKEKSGWNKERSIKYDKTNRSAGINELKKSNQFNFFQDFINRCNTGPILSVGCGTMYWDQRLKTNLPLIPLDSSFHMLEKAILEKRTRFGMHADGKDLPFADNQFELTYCIDALPENWYDKEGDKARKRMIREMFRVTRPNAKVILLLPNMLKARFVNLVKLKKLRKRKADAHGFHPREICEEVKCLGSGNLELSYKMCVTPFHSQKLINLTDRIAAFLNLNFLGMIQIVAEKK